MNNQSKSKAWAWVPSLYFTEGIPYAFVMIVSVVLYKKLDISNSEIALYTSWLYLPWVIKPFWSPFIDLIKTKRYWIILTQLIVGASLAGIAFSIPTDSMLQYTLAFSGSWHLVLQHTISLQMDFTCLDCPITINLGL